MNRALGNVHFIRGFWGRARLSPEGWSRQPSFWIPVDEDGFFGQMQDRRSMVFGLPLQYGLHRPRVLQRATNWSLPLIASGSESPETTSSAKSTFRKKGLYERLYLLAVPLIWSTYSPSMRFLFQFADASPPPALLNLGPALCGALGFLGMHLIRCWRQASVPHRQEPRAMPAAQTMTGIRIGVELGVYMFVGTFLQLLALQFSPASQVGFLLQASVVFTALFQRWTERHNTSKELSGYTRYSGPIACNLLGTALLILDDNPNLLPGKPWQHSSLAFIHGCKLLLLPSRLAGQLCALAAAMLYALFTVRLSDERVRTTSAFAIATTKTTTLATLSVLWYFLRPDWRSDQAFFTETGWAGISAYLLSTLWNGLLGTSLTTWFQIRGQGVGRVSATEAGILYATSPLWGALLSMVLLHERMGPFGWLGAALVFLSIVAMNLPSQLKRFDSDHPSEAS
jgi:drug/metabolite transporter (DMT)-like permease